MMKWHFLSIVHIWGRPSFARAFLETSRPFLWYSSTLEELLLPQESLQFALTIIEHPPSISNFEDYLPSYRTVLNTSTSSIAYRAPSNHLRKLVVPFHMISIIGEWIYNAVSNSPSNQFDWKSPGVEITPRRTSKEQYRISARSEIRDRSSKQRFAYK